MVNPQPDQFTRISNEILEVMAKTPLNGTQRRIIDVVLRYTYGFNRKSHELSLTFISSAMDMKKTQLKQVKRELDKLIDMKILIESKAPTKNSTRILGFNKYYDQWTIKTSGLIRPVDELDQSPVVYLDQSTSGLIRPVRKKDIKEIYKEIYSEESNEVILSNLLFKKMRENNPKCKTPNIQKWAEHIDKLIRIDGQSIEDISRVIIWCQEDNFWKSNILSPEKLRKKFDQLFMKSKSNTETPDEKRRRESNEFINKYAEEDESDDEDRKFSFF
jgi:phage replication O-like protein O